MKNNIAPSLTVIALLFSGTANLHAQQVFSSQANAIPLTANPAYAGMFNGSVRANGIFRYQDNGDNFHQKVLSASADLPFYINKKGNYLSAGFQFTKETLDEELPASTGGQLTVAYHKSFGMTDFKKINKGSDLGIGIQAGVGSNTYLVNSFYWNPTTIFYTATPPFVAPPIYRNTTNYFVMNAGLSFSQSISNRLNYTAGISGLNLYQKSGVMEVYGDYYKRVIPLTFNAMLSVNWRMSEHFILRPTIYNQLIDKDLKWLSGTELQYMLSKKAQNTRPATSFFAGAYYRSFDVITLTSGVEFKSFRLGLGYEWYVNSVTYKQKPLGFELALRFTAPDKLIYSRVRAVPSSHF